MIRRSVCVLSVVAIFVAFAAQSAGQSRSRSASAPVQACGSGSWIAGTVEICDGRLVYRDYVYDDYGADESDPTAPTTAPLARPAGDERYPEGQESTADIVDVVLDIRRDTLVARFEMNALYDAGSTLVGLAIDTDNDKSTGGGEWDGFDVSSEGWDELYKFGRGDTRKNLITGRAPVPEGSTWRVQAVAAQKDGNVMNVAFRGTDETTSTGAWWEDKQAAALRSGDITEFGHVVEVGDLTGDVTKRQEIGPGFYQRVYVSDYTLRTGEGMSYNSKFGRHGDTGSVCEQEFNFFGRYQPYGLYVPDNPGPHGMQLALHGCSANQSSLVDQPGMQQVMGEEYDRVIVVPLGRGPFGYYSDISERDVLDVMSDVQRNYPIDRDRVYAGGYSMGGYGAFRLAMAYPHRFAGLISWVGFTGDCFNGTVLQKERRCKSGGIGNVLNWVRNLAHVPSALLYAGADELVHTPSHQAMATKFRNRNSPYIYYFHPAAEHFTLALADDWRKEAEWTQQFTRVKNPARVKYRTHKWFWSPKYDIRHDRAYWVRRIRPRESKRMNLTVFSRACDWTNARKQEGVDAGPEPVPWEADLRTITGTKAGARESLVTARLRNIRSLKIDARASCIAGKRFRYVIDSDGASLVRLSDGRTIRAQNGTTKGVLKR